MANNTAALAKSAHISGEGSGAIPNLIHGDQALADAINSRLSTVRTWRSKRLIPYIKTGHKSVIYDLNKVLAALGALEVKPVTSKGGK